MSFDEKEDSHREVPQSVKNESGMAIKLESQSDEKPKNATTFGGSLGKLLMTLKTMKDESDDR